VRGQVNDENAPREPPRIFSSSNSRNMEIGISESSLARVSWYHVKKCTIFLPLPTLS
jgi:hypothetical protein